MNIWVLVFLSCLSLIEGRGMTMERFNCTKYNESFSMSKMESKRKTRKEGRS